MIQIIYASTSGNVELVCEYISEFLKSHNIESKLHRAEVTSIDVIKNNNNFILATSTWEHGELNPFFVKLLEEMKTTDLNGKVAAFVGLGDVRYEPILFCEGMNILRRTFLAQNGKEMHHALRVNGDPSDQLEEIVKPWAEGFAESVSRGNLT